MSTIPPQFCIEVKGLQPLTRNNIRVMLNNSLIYSDAISYNAIMNDVTNMCISDIEQKYSRLALERSGNLDLIVPLTLNRARKVAPLTLAANHWTIKSNGREESSEVIERNARNSLVDSLVGYDERLKILEKLLTRKNEMCASDSIDFNRCLESLEDSHGLLQKSKLLSSANALEKDEKKFGEIVNVVLPVLQRIERNLDATISTQLDVTHTYLLQTFSHDEEEVSSLSL